MTNDGPVTKGSPITFYARLDHAYDEYIYEFQDTRDFSRTQNVKAYAAAQASFVFDDRPAGVYVVRVQVWFTIFGNKAWVVDSADSSYSLSGIYRIFVDHPAPQRLHNE